MNDLGVFAIGGYHTIDGVQYHLTPLTAADFAEARAFIRTLSPDPMEGVVDMCNALASQETGKALSGRDIGLLRGMIETTRRLPATE